MKRILLPSKSNLIRIKMLMRFKSITLNTVNVVSSTSNSENSAVLQVSCTNEEQTRRKSSIYLAMSVIKVRMDDFVFF